MQRVDKSHPNSVLPNVDNTSGGASYPLQLCAHIYFIAGGLWFWIRYRFLRVFGKTPDFTIERSGLASAIRKYFSLLLKWRIIEVEYSGFEESSSWRGSIIAPNHPTALDAFFFLGYLPLMDCVMTAKLLRNPVTSGAVGLCDFIRNDSVASMIKTCRSRLANGSNILIFPEGTRTRKKPINPLHPVYVLAAKCHKAPIRTVMIECDSDYFGKSFSHFKPTRCPIRYRITAGREFHTDDSTDTRELSREIEEYFRSELPGM
jgi:1-acyl-sn-glycerol-3-phosphate acyltransferase